ncbi:MAG TPA: hypothetical protein VHM28_10630, partial [Anaerolineales bacterium]|nr:hypothetical protein [Anaerolineales bacterium]
DLLKEVSNLTRPDIPEVMRTKGDILMMLNRDEEARQTLTEARTLAERIGAKHELWPILSSLATLESKSGKSKESESLRAEARKIAEEIARTLPEPGLRDAFLSRPQVQALTR